jgi:hypothetical protein
MLTSEPLDPGPRRPARQRSRATLVLLTLAALVVLVLRHDYWNWDTPHPLLFGFLPVGLWWQALVSVLACALMWLMVRFAWPQELEDAALEVEASRRGPADDAAGANREENAP